MGSMKKKSFYNLISLFTAIVLFITLLPYKGVVSAEETDKISMLQVEINGVKEEMKVYQNGLYETDIDGTGSDIKYDVIKDGKTVTSKTVKADKDTKIYVRYSSKDDEVYDSVNDKNSFKTSGTLVGGIESAIVGGQTWKQDDANMDMEYIGGGFYKRTFDVKPGATGKVEYKVSYGHSWDNGEIGSNASITLTGKESKLTVIGNYLDNYVMAYTDLDENDLNVVYSLIGSARGEKDTWEATAKGYEFTNLSEDGKLVYSKYYKAGTYEYKAVGNYAWDDALTLPSAGDNGKFTVPEGGAFVVFVIDPVAHKMYTSIENENIVLSALGLKSGPVEEEPEEVKSQINANGTITFKYQNKKADSVYVAGNFTNWDDGKIALDVDNDGVWSYTTRLGDSAREIEYKFVVDNEWIVDPTNDAKSKDGNSLISFPEYKGRKVVLAGDIQTALGESGSWNPAGGLKSTMTYVGNGVYELSGDLKAGTYLYKVAMGDWGENYGANAEKDGKNISITVPEDMNVKFTYNDDSHVIVNSLEYNAIKMYLKDGNSKVGVLEDKLLDGRYSIDVSLEKGTYSNYKIVLENKEVTVPTFNVSRNKVVTISYDPTLDLAYTNAADVKVKTKELYYNSRSTEYKKPYGALADNETATFKLKTGDDVTKVQLVVQGDNGVKYVDLTKGKNNMWSGKYEATEIGIYKYFYLVSNGEDTKVYGDDDTYFGEGKGGEPGTVKPYEVNVYKSDYKTPDWMKNGIMYQIFPDRFFNGDTSNDYAQTIGRGTTKYTFPTDWYSMPDSPVADKDTSDGEWSNDLFGGDLKGIEKKLDYLQSLGVSIVYINPINASISNHRYDISDYEVVDAILGNLDDFTSLIKAASKRDMKIILDGVFNHVSDDSVYFDRYGKYKETGKPLGAYQYWSRVYDIMNEKSISQEDAIKAAEAEFKAEGITDFTYSEWFKIYNEKAGDHYRYEGWNGFDSMPVIQALDGSELNVKSWAKDIISDKDSVTNLWLDRGTSGWRLDVADEVSDETWRAFRDAVKEAGQDNVVIGEIWTDASKYLLGDMYDSVMNYRFRGSVLGYASGSKTADLTMNELEKMREQYPKEAFQAMMNLVGSHDKPRVLSSLDGVDDSDQSRHVGAASEKARSKMNLIPFFQMTYPGTPTIYYGDELGMVGAADPDNRRGMIWGKGDKELVERYATLAAVRNAYSTLRTGDINPISTGNDAVIAYERFDKNNEVLVLMNNSSKAQKVTIDLKNIDAKKLYNALDKDSYYDIADGKITVKVPAMDGLILVKKFKKLNLNLDGLKDGYDEKYVVAERIAYVEPTNPTDPSKPTKSDEQTESGNTGNNSTSAGNNDNKKSTNKKNSPSILSKTGGIGITVIVGMSIIVVAIGVVLFRKKKKIS